MTETTTLSNERWLRQVTTPLGQARVPCHQCGLESVCEALGGGDKGHVRRGRIGAGKPLFKAGEPFHGVYAVTAGAIKTVASLDQGRDQVVEFHFPGDTVGLEAVDRGAYSYTAQALTETLVCRVAIGPAALGAGQPALQAELLRVIGEQLRHEQSLSILLRQQSAEQRVITFLLSLAGPSIWARTRGVELQLPMSRKDIANYLGIAVETLCRLFRHLQDTGLIESDGRRVRLLEVDALGALARPAETRPA
ncbi:MAG: Crp/Fnr family transcriptional regulator [Gammaproteobacteria bacterium]